MSEPENFLTRWARRKQQAGHTAEKPDDVACEDLAREDVARDDAAIEGAVEGSEPTPALREANKEPEFDLSSLPSIDSIGAGTDVRVFLQKGVPLELTRAALRRVWVSDPTIRDFIEVAENQWDFATGSDLPGFGPLDGSDDVRRLVAEVFEGRLGVASPETGSSSSEKNSARESPEQQTSMRPRQTEALQNSDPQNLQIKVSVEDETIVHRGEENAASQHDARRSDDSLPTKRIHGRALPQ